jgi:hypothetical protein
MPWFGPRKPEYNADRNSLRVEDNRELTFILNEWDISNKLILAVFLANDWRIFLDSFGSPNEFERMPRSTQIQYFEKLLAYSTRTRNKSAATEGVPNAESMELLCESLSMRFLASYVMCLIEKDRQWEGELAPNLDQLLELGWQLSLSSLPLPSDYRHLPMEDPSKPQTRFTRQQR